MKRKRAAERKFYAVRVGRAPGIYLDWPSCQAQITGYSGAAFKAFPTEAEAEAFVNGERTGRPFLNTNKLPQSGSSATVKVNSTVENPKVTLKIEDSNGDGNPLPVPHTIDGEVENPASEASDKASSKSKSQISRTDDNFDFQNKLDKRTGKVRPKTARELAATKAMPKQKDPGNTIHIYTDGACRANGRKGAVAGVGVYFGPGDKRNVSEPLEGRQTNQRAELTAVRRALDISPINRNVVIFTDSSYAINCITVWCKSWIKNGWITSSKKAVENRDLVEKILAKLEVRNKAGGNTEFTWVKGHSDDPGNIAADNLAVQGAMRKPDDDATAST